MPKIATTHVPQTAANLRSVPPIRVTCEEDTETGFADVTISMRLDLVGNESGHRATFRPGKTSAFIDLNPETAGFSGFKTTVSVSDDESLGVEVTLPNGTKTVVPVRLTVKATAAVDKPAE